jgi:hypothetical protein
MQVHSHAAQRGTFGVMKDIVAKEGVGGLFKGLGPPLLASAVINSAMFSAYERALAVFQAQYIKQTTGETNMHSDRAQTVILPIPYYFLAGNAGGFASAIITCPVDVVKVCFRISTHHCRIKCKLWDLGMVHLQIQV